MDFRMSSSSSVVLLLIFCLFLDGTLAGKGRILSTKDNQLLETELKTLNKPLVKTIKKEDGKIYDCVNIYKQPTLDHHLLKSHRVQLRPSSASERNITEGWKPIKMELENGCPKGTVLIPRTTKEELGRAKSLFKQYQSYSFPLESAAGVGYDVAGIEMKVKPNTKYHGAEAIINVYQPKEVQQHQYSSTLIRLHSGLPGSLSYIQAGWMVNPDLYGDGKTRFYIYWMDVHDGKLSGCFNIYCAGFVVTSPNTPVDFVLRNVSEPGGAQFEVKIAIDQDPRSGNWWLKINDEDDNVGIVLGYWPKELIKHLDFEGAETVIWGGEVYSNTSSSPPMGSGKFNKGDFLETCFMRQVKQRVNKDELFTIPNAADVRIRESRCYFAVSYNYVDSYWGYRFSFGGEGGDNGDCKGISNGVYYKHISISCVMVFLIEFFVYLTI